MRPSLIFISALQFTGVCRCINQLYWHWRRNLQQELRIQLMSWSQESKWVNPRITDRDYRWRNRTYHMDVSKNSGKTPKSSILIGFSIIINHPFWGTTIFGNTHIISYLDCERLAMAACLTDNRGESTAWASSVCSKESACSQHVALPVGKAYGCCLVRLFRLSSVW